MTHHDCSTCADGISVGIRPTSSDSNDTAGPASVFEHAVRTPSELAAPLDQLLKARRNTASAQLEQLTYNYVSAPLTSLTTLFLNFIMPNTKSVKAQRPSGATAPVKDKSKSSKTAKDFTEIDTSSFLRLVRKALARVIFALGD